MCFMQATKSGRACADNDSCLLNGRCKHLANLGCFARACADSMQGGEELSNGRRMGAEWALHLPQLVTWRAWTSTVLNTTCLAARTLYLPQHTAPT
jgi:hypothetical protein